jgi:hypothetical protein
MLHKEWRSLYLDVYVYSLHQTQLVCTKINLNYTYKLRLGYKNQPVNAV